MTGGEPVHRPELIGDSDFTIVGRYGQEYRGYTQYYAFAQNRYWLHRLHWVMRTSLLKTLAAKHKSSVTKMAERFAARVINENGVAKCLQVVVQRPDKSPLVATFGGQSLTTQPFHWIEDRLLDRDRVIHRNELLKRVLADECELCGSRDRVEVHHVRKLADLRVEGRKGPPIWKQVMASRRRKTLVVCGRCHDAIHAGRPTGTREPQDADTTGS